MKFLLEKFNALLGTANVLAGADAVPYLTDWRKSRTGKALAVLRPGNTEDVSEIVRLCAGSDVSIVPRGGNTGQVAGATPDDSGDSVVLSLSRLDRIREIDPENNRITVEAGCVLERVQEAAAAADRLFPLSLGAQGRCQIGGNLATNAGGTQVLRYGDARDLALGLEVVTAEGEIWHGPRGLRKDNSGYALRDLYIGSEGTLGIITAATLKLFPLPTRRHTAFLALDSLENAAALLQAAQSGLGPTLTAFAAQQGTVDGLEIPLPVIYTNKFPEVTEYLSMTKHAYNGLFIYRELSPRQLYETVLQSLKLSGMIMFIICAAFGYAYLMATTQIPLQIAGAFLSISSSPVVILLFINLLLLVLGAAMDNVSAMVILSGVLTTIGAQFGMDPIQLGAMVVINFAVGMVTPPVGYSIFVAAAISGLKIEQIVKPLLPFLFVLIVLILLVTYVPALTTWLPNRLR